MSLIIELPRAQTYHVPEGAFSGRCINVSETTNLTDTGPIKQVRFWFQLDIPSMGSVTPMAARNLDYDLNSGSKLMRFLEVWLGRNFISRNTGGKFDLASLKGQKVEVLVEHIHNDTHDKPFALVKGVYRPGKLTLTEQPATNGMDAVDEFKEAA